MPDLGGQPTHQVLRRGPDVIRLEAFNDRALSDDYLVTRNQDQCIDSVVVLSGSDLHRCIRGQVPHYLGHGRAHDIAEVDGE